MDSAKELRKRLAALNRAPLRPEEAAATAKEIIKDEIKRRSKASVRQEAGAKKASKTSAKKPAIRIGARKAPSTKKPVGGPPSAQPIIYRRDVPDAVVTPVRPRVVAGTPVELEKAVRGVVAAPVHGGTAYVTSAGVLTREGKPSPLNAAYRDALECRDTGVRTWIADLCELDEVRPADVIFFDLETTGLTSTPLFLIGAMSWENDGLAVRQFFARDYSEEAAIIALFLEWAASKRLLVSFNGKSFDLPYVRVRAAANGVPFALDLPHLDLLHVARRIWKYSLPNCRLQTLEVHVCGRVRHGDIPSWEIPEAYHAYVRTSNAVEMVEVLRHNLSDLVTLADLMVRLPHPPDPG
ncbi:MAG: ribonuclease H-like domain-containing protein [Verrucomicrobia bacterium]|nr:ribonuclease H-like domain-containing protein [Verrucomicrobiota bacterium]